MEAPNRSATDWVAWHHDYADRSSALSQRLDAVTLRAREALTALPPGPIRLISACAGQGRDVIAALEGHPRAPDVVGRLVEADPSNAAMSREALDSAGLSSIESVCGDASLTDAYAGVAPADLVLLCGIFGNISDADVHTTVRHAATLCAPGAYVIWTRHREAPDLTPRIRDWFEDSGFEAVAFDVPDSALWSVGTQRLSSPPSPFTPGIRLFTFIR